MPIDLQAFVLHDDEGLHVETGHGRAPLFDPSHLSAVSDIDIPAKSKNELQEVVSKAKERINREIEMVEEKTAI